jgi:hypothetical protein
MRLLILPIARKRDIELLHRGIPSGFFKISQTQAKVAATVSLYFLFNAKYFHRNSLSVLGPGGSKRSCLWPETSHQQAFISLKSNTSLAETGTHSA